MPAQETLRSPVDPREIKLRWLKALEEARALLGQMNPKELGCLYVNESGMVRRAPAIDDKPHYGRVRGAWLVLG